MNGNLLNSVYFQGVIGVIGAHVPKLVVKAIGSVRGRVMVEMDVWVVERMSNHVLISHVHSVPNGKPS